MVQVYIHEECFISMDHNLHFNLGDSLMFDSFIQQHIYFICSPTIAVWPLARFSLAHKSTWSQKRKYMAALVGVWKYTTIRLLGLGTCHAINRQIRDPKVRAEKKFCWSLSEEKKRVLHWRNWVLSHIEETFWSFSQDNREPLHWRAFLEFFWEQVAAALKSFVLSNNQRRELDQPIPMKQILFICFLFNLIMN